MENVSGRSSGWQEKWPSGSSGNGNGGTTTGGGFRDHSDDEDTSRRSPEDDFRDEDFDSGFGSKKQSASATSGSTFQDVSGSSEPKSSSLSSYASKPATSAAPRVKKPIDLGAAAAFAAKPPAQQQKQQQPAADPYQNYNPIVADLFAADDDVSPATASHTKVVTSNLSFDADDFDPRDSANANGAFGDFSAAFSPPKSDNQASSVALDDGDDFADFSSAFGSGTSNPAPSSIPTAVFSSGPVAPPSAAPMFDLFSDSPSTEKVSTVDLLSGLDLGGGSFVGQISSAPAPSNMGGLSGLNFSPPPPLIGAHSMGLVGGAPLQPQSSNSGSFFDFNSQGSMGGPQLQPHNSNNNVINSNSSMSASNSSSNFSKKPTTWDTVAGVNIDLDNLKLGGKSQKKPALPMNALMTPTSSPTKGFANQPPSMMKPGTISSNNLL